MYFVCYYGILLIINFNMENSSVIQFGVHYMLDGYGADQGILSDATTLKLILDTLPAKMGMHPLNEPVVVEVGEKNRKDPGGLSGFVMIAESHISFHTFPKRGFVTIDVYTCQNDLDTDRLTREFTEAFQLKEADEFIKKRGTKYPVENIY
jgi:S-adenosylmethionine decarboxylase